MGRRLSLVVVSVSLLLAIFEEPTESLEAALSLALPGSGSRCLQNEERRICGPYCPPTCETLNTNVCCIQNCVMGCFCKDGYILQSSIGPKRCIPISQCRKYGVIHFATSRMAVEEDIGIARVRVLRTGSDTGEVSVRWRAKDITAVNGQDYNGPGGQIFFRDKEMEKFVDIRIINDREQDPNEEFELHLYDPSSNAEIGDPKVITITIKENDRTSGVLEFEKDRLEVPRNIGTARLPVIRNGGTDGELILRWRSKDRTAKHGDDYFGSEGELIVRDGETRKNIDIQITNNEVIEGDREFEVELLSAAPRSLLGPRSTMIVVIKEIPKKRGLIQFETRNVTIVESAKLVQLVVVRNRETEGRATVRYVTFDGTAVRGSDYKPVMSGMVLFANGESRKTIEIEIIDDNIREPDEQFRVQLISPSGAALGFQITATVTILDDDGNPGKFGFVETSVSTIESKPTVMLTVMRTDGTDGTVTVRWRTSDITATRGEDYGGPTSGDLIFRNGVTAQSISIPIIDDRIKEADEKFSVQLSSPTGGAILGRDSVATVTILDDDKNSGIFEFEESTMRVLESVGTAEIAVVRNEGSDGDVLLRWRTKDGTAKHGEDYLGSTGELLFPDGVVRQTIKIEIIDDRIREDDEEFVVELITATERSVSLGRSTTAKVIIIDNDSVPGKLDFQDTSVTVTEGIPTATLTVVRKEGADGTVTVRWRTSDITAINGQDYRGPTSGELTFHHGVTVQRISIPIIDDRVKEPDEQFNVQLSSPTGGAVLGRDSVATVTIIDDDKIPGIFEFERSKVEVLESDGTAEIAVVRTEGSDGDVLVRWRAKDKTAIHGEDYLGAAGELLFPDGVTRQTIKIPIIDDSIREDDEEFVVELLTATERVATLGRRTTATVIIKDNDSVPGKLDFQVTSVTVTEGMPTATLTVLRKEGADGTVTVRWRTSDITAINGQDYRGPTSGELTFPHGVTVERISIPIIDDRIKEPIEQFSVQLSSPTGGAVVGRDSVATVTIIDDDKNSGIFEFERSKVEVLESDGTAEIAVVRTEGSDGDVLVRWRAEDKTAIHGEDYLGSSGELLFPDGVTRQTIKIPIIDDSIREDDEEFVVELLTATERVATLGRRTTATVVIKDNDSRPGIIEFERTSLKIPESIGFAQLVVSRTQGTDGTVSVTWTTRDRTAIRGEDYGGPSSGEVIFRDGESQKLIEIPIIDDKKIEGDEEFTVQISSPQGGAILGSKTIATVTITDDDKNEGIFDFEVSHIEVPENIGIAKLVVVRNQGTDGTVVVRWRTADRTAKIGEDYLEREGEIIFPEGVSRKTIDIQIIDDNVKEDDEQFIVELTSATSRVLTLGRQTTITVTIKDNDAKPGMIQFKQRASSFPESSGRVSVPVHRIQGTDGLVTVRWRTEDKTAIRGVDYEGTGGQLVFGDGESEKNLEIDIIDDFIREPSETFDIVLFDPSGGAILGPIRITTITILDDDAKPGKIEFEDTAVSVPENAKFAHLVVSRKLGTDGTVSVRWRTADSTAIRGEDYGGPLSGELIFRDGESSRVLDIPIIDDKRKEPEEQFTVHLSSPEGGAVLGRNIVATITITDDDKTEGIFEFEVSHVEVPENIGIAKLVVVRDQGTDGTVVVRWRTLDRTAKLGEDYLGREGEIIFPEGVSRKTIDIQIIDDNVKEDDEQFVVELTSATSRVLTLGRQTTITVTIKDNDAKPGMIQFKRRAFPFPENAGRVSIPVQRTHGRDGLVTVRWRTVDKTATRGEDYEGTGGQLVFRDGELEKNLEVEIINDRIRESNETFDVVLFDPTGGAVLGPIRIATVTILDDDENKGIFDFEVSHIEVPENIGIAKLVVVRNQGTDGTVVVRWRTVDRTAKLGEDYLGREGEIIFPEGVSRKTIDIEIMDDNVKEDDEQFIVELMSATSRILTLGRQTTIAVTIKDNDDFPKSLIQFKRRSGRVKENAGLVLLPVTVIRRGGPPFEVTVKWKTVDRTAVDREDFVGGVGTLVFGPEESEKRIQIPIIDDKVDETNELFDVMLFDPSPNAQIGTPSVCTVEIMDDDENNPGVIQFSKSGTTVGETDGEVSIEVIRAGGSDGMVSVRWNIIDISTTLGSDYRGPSSGTTVFRDGETRKILRIPIIDDHQPEDSEKFQVVLLSPTGGATLGEPKTFIVTIIDNDQSDPCVVGFSRPVYRVKENVGAVDLTLLRSGNIVKSLAVRWNTVDGTAKGGVDYIARDEIIIFGPTQTEAKLRVTILDNSIVQPERSFVVKLHHLKEVFHYHENSEATVIIEDDDKMIPGGYACESNLVWLECLSCQKTCEKPVCTVSRFAPCYPGCGCPDYLYLDESRKQCVTLSDCPSRKPPPRRIRY